MQKVGLTKIQAPNRKNPEKMLTRKLYYTDLPRFPDNWLPAASYLPKDFDLVYVKLKNGIEKIAWFQGMSWDGKHIKSDDEVVFWKRKYAEDE